MDEQRICPGCKKALPADAPMGLCPECLIKSGFPTGVETDMGSATQPPFVPPAIEELARRFPQLEILELIGKGGMGAVYKARQKQLNRFVALKILPPDTGRDAAFTERFMREAQALAQLNHPGIVTLYESGEASGQFYFLMEFVDGVNLRQLLATSRVSPREALAIVPQICDALQYAHDQGIVHRDIKPENILLDRRGRVKVADFGLAKVVGKENEPAADQTTAAGSPALTDAGKVMGTPNYMSPEQMKNPGAVDHRADIYALGVVFYQMLTGELPGKQLQPPSAKVQIDVRLDEIVLRALEKKPELRYQQASALKTQIETIASAASPADPTPNALARADWRTWSPLGSPQVREIMAHLTAAEKKDALRYGGLFAVWNAATAFVPFFCVMFLPKPTGWFLGAGSLLAGLFFYPTWYRLQKKFLCSTEWAQKRGYTIHNLRNYSFSAGNLWRAVLITVGILLAFYAVEKLVLHDSVISRTADSTSPVSDATHLLDEQPPVVVETVPVSGTTDVAPGEMEIRVRFSKPMSDNGWSWTTALPDSPPEIIGEPHYESDHKTCVLKVKLGPNRDYGFWLNSERFGNFTDQDGRSAVPYLLTFKTKAN